MHHSIKCRHWLFGLVSLSLLFVFASLTYASQAELDEINYAIHSKGAHWLAGETSVSKLPPQARKMRLGALKPVLSKSDVTRATASTSTSSSTSTSATTAPATLDWRNYNGYDYVTPVRDQGNCGSCWAFATTAALESNVLIMKGISALDLAEQVLLSCSGAGSCSGGYIDYASNFIVSPGLPPESYYPYTATNGQCSNAAAGWQNVTSMITSWHWTTTTSPTVDAIKNDLNTYGPLVTTMDVYTDFFYYAGGVYQYTYGSYQGGHAILIVGYDDTGQYFIVKNSWGSGWGESGYFRIAYSQLSNVVNFGDYTIGYYTSNQSLVSITVASSPSGEQINVDGTAYTAPHAFSWAPGSSHTIGVPSPQSGGTGVRYVFSSWSDGGSQSHTITTPSAAATYTASLATQYQLTTSVSPTGTGGVTPNCSGGCWYNSGASASLTAVANTGYTFSSWSGAISSTGNPVAVTMNTAKVVTANFSGSTFSVSGSVKTTGGAAISGVTMTLSGAGSATTATDTYGNYMFSGIANGNYTITPGTAGYTFTPTSAAVTVSGANVSGQNFTGTTTAGALPNLTPYQPAGWSDKIVVSKRKGQTTDDTTLYRTDKLYVDWSVINNGTASTNKTFYTYVYVDGVQKASWYLSSQLAPNYYISVTGYSIGRLPSGTHTVKIVTDATGAISESNETDNIYTKTITVQ